VSSYLVYWKPQNVNWQNPSSGRLRHAASNQFHKVRAGNALYFITYRGGRFFLLGQMRVHKVASQRDAAKYLGCAPERLWPADYHALATTAEARPIRVIACDTALRQLKTISGSKVRSVKEPLTGSTFQTMRLLTPGSAQLLDNLLAKEVEDHGSQEDRPRTGGPTSDVDEFDVEGHEGNTEMRMHLCRERNASIVAAKRRQVLQRTGKLVCEVCGFDFQEAYGTIGEGFCEVHHLRALSEAKSEVETRLEDLSVICSNCHRMIHRFRPFLAIVQLKKHLLRSREA
jgi:hypothetical protein